MFKKIVFFLVLHSAFAWASGFAIYEQNARATGMAGAFIARANDASAIFYNPAGITQLSGWHINMGSTMIQSQFGFTGPANMDARFFTKAQKGTFYPSHFYLTYHLKNKFAIGVGVYTPFGLGSNWGNSQHPWVGRLLATKSEFKTVAINPVIAVKPISQLSLAIGFSFLHADVNLEKDVYFAARAIFGHSQLQANSQAFGFNLGLQYTLLSRLHLGLQYRSPIALEFSDGKANFYFPQTTDDIINQEIRSFFPKSTKSTAALTLPASYGLGLAYDFTENLSFEVDYLVQAWSSYDQLKITFAQPVAGTTENISPKNYQDSYSLRFGMEYQMDNHISLRAGYLWDKHAVPNEYVEPSLPESDRHNYTLGLGYRLKNLTLDVAYHLLLQDDRQVTNTIHQFDGEYIGMANIYSLSLGYSF